MKMWSIDMEPNNMYQGYWRKTKYYFYDNLMLKTIYKLQMRYKICLHKTPLLLMEIHFIPAVIHTHNICIVIQ